MARFRELSTPMMMLHVSAKVIFGIGIGMLLGAYIEGVRWSCVGWSLLIVSILISIPSTCKILGREKKSPEGLAEGPPATEE
ncbi:MAG: hypothetical protein QF662_00785 [Phycisphaerae bacterium]|nr:hypothetical protein [Phycisphaerae bacterium]